MSSDASSMNIQPVNCGRPAMPRTIDLFGRTADGRTTLWKRAVQVEPVTAFERYDRWIRSGHYVVDHNGDVIVVHCGNVHDDSISVQFMHEELTPDILPRHRIGSMLLSEVVVSVEQQAAVIEGRRLSDFFP